MKMNTGFPKYIAAKGMVQKFWRDYDLAVNKAISYVDMENIFSVNIPFRQFIREYEEEDTNNIVRLYRLEKPV